MQEYLLRAGEELGLRVVAPVEDVKLEGVRLFHPEVLFKDLGYPNGTLVARTCDDFLATVEELKKLGYGLSVFDEPLPNEIYDLKSYKEMFIDWGWSGDLDKKPVWLTKPKDDEDN